jgi:Domain of unknown function (DUF4169)
MGDIINLRQQRKQKSRAEKDQKAEANRQHFGRSKAEKQLTKAGQLLAAKQLDGHKRDDT